ncbi:MAG: hypothetical protein HYY06_04260 [Deltaproteobacteria bacterium]|nr:hypothetical protein [Deltaproteobacteria bacterium]
MVRLAAVTLVALGCSSEPQGASIATLDHDFEPLRAAFDADAGRVRLLAILSPT